MTTNILLCGVGGQGTLLASNLLAESAMENGFDVKKSEIHGMAQRGGSVVSHVRYGDKIASPIIRKGECDILLAFEELEALRWSEFLRPDGLIISNAQNILPMSVSAGNSTYPAKINEKLGQLSVEVISVDAIGKAKELGNQKCLNVVLLGVLARKLEGMKEEVWVEQIEKRVPPKFLELNKKAFEAGWNLA
jgi:indolepyruvate ferredoxin oxidoreductase beta subunit